jgi:hypothetical protein
MDIRKSQDIKHRGTAKKTSTINTNQATGPIRTLTKQKNFIREGSRGHGHPQTPKEKTIQRYKTKPQHNNHKNTKQQTHTKSN